MTTARSSTLERRRITDGLIQMLATAVGKPCGDHAIPPGATLLDGYTIVYSLSGGSFTGAPLWAPESDAILQYQISSVASERNQAEWIADRVRKTMTSRTAAGGFQVAFPDPAGARVTGRWPDDLVPGVIPTGSNVEDRTYTIPDRFNLAVEAT
jgi:hypothetical protein